MVIATKGGTTGGLKRHLEAKHSDKLKNEEASAAVPIKKPAKQTTISFTLKMCLEERLARFAAEDGMSYHMMANSSQLQEFMREKGLKMPTPPIIAKKVSDFANSVKEEKKQLIEKLKKDGVKFSIDLDEYTSIQNKRLVSVNLFFNEDKDKVGLFNLGLVRMIGSFKAEDHLQLLERKLDEFGLSLAKDIVCLTTDGAAVMVKMGKLSPTEHQECHAHGLNLGITDVIYKKAADTNNNLVNDDKIEDGEDEDSDNDSLDDEETSDDLRHIFATAAAENQELRYELKVIVKKIRNIVKLFRKSPVKNDTLRTYTKQQFGKEMALILDVKTRWTSLYAMLQRFIMLRAAVTKSFIDLEEFGMNMSEQEMIKVQELANALEPLTLASERICRREATLVTADDTFEFVLEELRKQNTFISVELFEAVERRVSERRNNNLVHLLRYLQDHTLYSTSRTSDCESVFRMPTKLTVINCAEKLVKRLYETPHQLIESDSKSVKEEPQLSLQDRLDKFVSRKVRWDTDVLIFM